jgi:Superfamily II helicase and inactivated derivatives
MASLLEVIWPPEGLRCLVAIHNGRVRHTWSSSPNFETLLSTLNTYPGVDWYFAPATYAKSTRQQAHVHSLKAFWLDVDAGEGKGYPSLIAAAEALRDFVHAAGLPSPWVIQSGRGMHVYWVLESPVVAALWKPVAERLKQACEKAHFAVGPERTADSASILRVPGTQHYKDPANPLPVRVLKEGAVVDFLVFSRALDKYCPAARDTTPSLAKSVNESMTATLATRTPSSAPALAQRCQQMARFRDAGGAVSEPFWYGAIQLLRYTDEAPAVIHEWSRADPRYDPAQTDAKIQQLADKDIGPTTCERLAAVSGQSALCTQCPYWKKITTPLVLGAQVDRTQEAAPGELPAPRPFFYDTQGRVGVRNPTTHVDEIIYPYPIKVIRRLKDDSQEYIEIACNFPRDGWQKILLPLSSLYSRNGIAEELAARGVLLDALYIDTMATFLTEATRQLQQTEVVSTLISQLGWRADGAFVDGQNAWTPEGTNATITFAPAVLGMAKGFGPSPGALMDEWRFIFRHYEKAPPEWQMAFLTAFAAPLMHFTGYGGATINLVGSTGVGKSTVQRIGCAVYGDPMQIMAQKHDTTNSLMQRLGVYRSLPLYVDEMTNVDPQTASDFVYQVSQGRERSRLSSDATMRPDRPWSTLVVSSTNASLASRLSSAKLDTRAELARVWEMYMPCYADQADLEEINQCALSQFGLIGPLWAKYLVANASRARKLVDTLQTHIRGTWGIQTRERYWQTLCAVTLAAARMLQDLGLARFDTKGLSTFMRAHIQVSRDKVEVATEASTAILGQFLNDTIRERLVMQVPPKHGSHIPLPAGLSAISTRYESVSGTLYISERRLLLWLEETKAATLSEVWSEWRRLGYRPARARKTLGDGYEGAWAHVNVVRLYVPEATLRAVQPPAPPNAEKTQSQSAWPP